MRRRFRLRKKIVFALLVIALVLPGISFGSPGGITGRTLKTVSTGCGSCHGGTASASVIVSINGPDTVLTGQTYNYTVMVTGGTSTTGGVDIAAFRGTFAKVSSFLKLSGAELTHNAKVALPATYEFTYTAPGTSGTDTLYATGKGGGFNSWNWAPNKTIIVLLATDVDGEDNHPTKFSLAQNFPNPFNPVTSIRYSLPRSSIVTLKIYDIHGKEVSTLVNESQPLGEHTVAWNGEGLSSGIYMYRISAADYNETKKMMLIK